MKRLLPLMMFMAAMAIACGSTVEVTREVEVTRLVEVTKEVEVPVTVEVTRISLQRVVETVEVPVTRVVDSNQSRIPRELCEDYPYMVALLESQRHFFNIKKTFATSVEGQQVYEIAVDGLSTQIDKVDSNRILICGNASQAYRMGLHMMKSSEGWAMCLGIASVARNHANPPSWRSVPLGERAGAVDLVFGIRDYCFDGSTELVRTVYFQDYRRILELLE